MTTSITLRDLSLGYGSRRLLDDVSACFRKGELTALIGRNGSGKSTLLRTIAGLNRGYTGEILLEDNDQRSLRAPELAKMVAFVSTQRTRIPNMRCEDVVAIGRAPYTDWIGRIRESDREAVENALDAIGMKEYARRTLDTMSDGECQRIMIARALAQDTPIILLDEPTSFLDMPSRYELAQLLHRLAHRDGKCIIFSTHELDIATRTTDITAIVENRTLRLYPSSSLTPEDILSRHFQR